MKPEKQIGEDVMIVRSGEPRPLSASASHIGCPLCGQSGVKWIDPVCAGEPQPGEEQPCLLCEGTTWVSAAEYILYKTDGLDAVLEARARVRRAAAQIYQQKENCHA